MIDLNCDISNKYRDLLTRTSDLSHLNAKQMLGHLRSLAANIKQQEPSSDEEDIFKLIVKSWTRGLKKEFCSVFGTEAVSDMFDPFKG